MHVKLKTHERETGFVLLHNNVAGLYVCTFPVYLLWIIWLASKESRFNKTTAPSDAASTLENLSSDGRLTDKYVQHAFRGCGLSDIFSLALRVDSRHETPPTYFLYLTNLKDICHNFYLINVNWPEITVFTIVMIWEWMLLTTAT